MFRLRTMSHPNKVSRLTCHIVELISSFIPACGAKKNLTNHDDSESAQSLLDHYPSVVGVTF